jgi:hypothetical protein
MRKSSLLLIRIAGVFGAAALLAWPALSPGQAPAPPAPVATGLGQPCNLMHDLVPANPPDPTPAVPNVLTRVDATTKSAILNSGLPCQETVTGGPDTTKTPLENRQRGFDFYSWLTFIALNSPADGRGIEKSMPDTKTKWEENRPRLRNFKQLLDVMLPGGKASKWEDEKVPPPGCRSQYKPGMMVIEMIEETFNQPFKTGPLIDQQGNYALFDILMNKQMFDYIQDHGLYSKAEQMSEKNAKLKVDFAAGFNPEKGKIIGGDPGAIIIKVSWKVLDPAKDKQKFHTVDALVSMPRSDGQNSEPPCLHKTLGLVGFHVMHKTKTRLQWIWTSFEHVDNVPEEKEVQSGKLKTSYNFYNPACDTAKCPVNQTPPRPWNPTYANGLKFHNPFRSQITRIIPLTDETKKMNKQFQDILGNTVWKNYMLLSTQWPSAFPCAQKSVDPPGFGLEPNTDFEKQPDMTCAPAPTYLANSTLETYSQGSEPLASSSCMACHGNAVSYQQRPPDNQLFNQSDFTFMLEKAR